MTGGKATEEEVASRLLPLVYRELRRLAGSCLRRPGQTLQATDLVHEAYLKLVDQHEVNWQNRAHFYGIAATLMRRILIDRARRRAAQRRAGDQERVAFDEALICSDDRSEALVLLDRALVKLAGFDPRQSRIVEMRFFGGMSAREIAEVLGIGERTVEREWKMAQAWLRREITGEA
jgi:RNA polymerase sigma factor (TIGR02999 family)